MSNDPIKLPTEADFSYIRDIAGGQHEAFRNLLRIVAKNLQEYPPQILAAHQQGNWTDMRALAHKYKSCTAYLNFPQLDEVLNGLEYDNVAVLSDENMRDMMDRVRIFSAFLHEEVQKVLQASMDNSGDV